MDKDRLAAAIGRFPDKAPLRPSTLESVDCGISAAEQDRRSRGAQQIFNAAQAPFPEGSLQLRIWPGGHAFTPAMREEAYRFLDEKLK